MEDISCYTETVWKYNIKMVPEEEDNNFMKWIHVAQNGFRRLLLVNTIRNHRTQQRMGNFLMVKRLLASQERLSCTELVSN
jgi:hypothetical protein